MFTGLIETTGTLSALTPTVAGTRITVVTLLAARLRTGDSIAVNGVCLTALDISPTSFSADLADETITRTTLVRLSPGAILNLELPTPAGSPLGGHVVQGHVDATGTLLSLTAIAPGAPQTTDWRLRMQLPDSLLRYVIPQGSITINGISLTVAAIHHDEVEIAIIPHTFATTNLHTLPPGSPLNIETDVLARYSDQLRKPEASHPLTVDYLLANGY